MKTLADNTIVYSQPSISTNSTYRGPKIFERNCYVAADVYYAVRLTVVVSVLNMYRLFFPCHYSLNNNAKQLFTWHSHYIRFNYK